VLAIAESLLAMMPRALPAGAASGRPIVADVAPSLAILAAWIWLTARAGRSVDALRSLPADLFRSTIAVGGVGVIVAGVATFTLAGAGGAAQRTLLVTTIEETLYGLGVVALGSLALFAVARTMLRSTLSGQMTTRPARDIPLRTRFLVASTGASFATAGVLLEVLVDFERTPDLALVGFLLTAAALVGFAAAIGWLVGDDTARSEHAAAAAAAERERIARELHDGVAKSVSALALEAAAVARRAPEALAPDLARIERLAQLLSEELRAIVSDVRSKDGAHAFGETLRRAVDRHPGARVEVDGEVDRIGTLARFEILRIVEEGLRNAERHAGAHEVVARIAVHGGVVDLQVEDDGRGLTDIRWDELARRGCYGLIGIRERAALLRGTISVGRGGLGGTLVRVAFPLVS
jgi:signal transduction histidine kinase